MLLCSSTALLLVDGVKAAGDSAAMEALAKKSGCFACHSIEKKVIGPAYKDVTQKYAGDATAEAKLIEKVKKGGSGVWGTMPMPPNPTVSEMDIKSLVAWILPLK